MAENVTIGVVDQSDEHLKVYVMLAPQRKVFIFCIQEFTNDKKSHKKMPVRNISTDQLPAATCCGSCFNGINCCL